MKIFLLIILSSCISSASLILPLPFASANEATWGRQPYDDAPQRRQRQIRYENARLAARNLEALPMCSTPNNGPYGSFHYNPDSSNTPPVDVYINPDTSCAFQNVLQEWNEKFCPDTATSSYEERGCRVAFGNISHRNTVNFPPHRTHRDGTCIDIRPMARGDFNNSGLNFEQSRYDRAMTAQFLRLAREHGATLMLFNDPNIRTSRAAHHVPDVRYAPGHKDHMHICFDPRRLNEQQRTCPSTPACGPARQQTTPFRGA